MNNTTYTTGLITYDDNLIHLKNELSIYKKEDINYPRFLITYLVIMYIVLLYDYIQTMKQNNKIKKINIQYCNKFNLLQSNYNKLEKEYTALSNEYILLNDKYTDLSNLNYYINNVKGSMPIVETRNYKDMCEQVQQIREHLEIHVNEVEKNKKLYEKYFKLYNDLKSKKFPITDSNKID